MNILKINHNVLKTIIEPENLTLYQKGFNIKNRAMVVKPITDLIVDIDSFMKNVLNVTYAMHNPTSGLYLTISLECKPCKVVAYNINIQVTPDISEELVELVYERKGDHDKQLTWL